MNWKRIATALALAAGLTGGAQAWAQTAPIDKELDKYWNVEQAVPALENPLFERKGGFEGSVHAGVVPNDKFHVPMPVGVRVGYFLTDTVSLEAGFSYLLDGKSELLDFLQCAGKSQKGCIDLTEGARKEPKMNFLGSLDVAWSPFHGKVGIFTSKLSSFDLGVSAGVGLINADIDESLDGESEPQSATKPAGHWGAGFRFYLTRWLNLRVDYKQFLYFPAGESFLAPVEFTAGVAFLSK